MKKIVLVFYTLQSIITNFVIIVMFYPIIIYCLFSFCSGRVFEHETSTLESRIGGGIGLLIFLEVYIIMNMVVYKLLAEKMKLKKIYLIIPIFCMVLSVFLGFYFKIKFP